MISKFRICNFKSFGSFQEARFAPLTLIYGQNSSGKSSIIQSLLLLKQSIDPDYNRTARLIFRGEQIDLGSYISCVHRHESKRNLLLGIDIEQSQARRRIDRRTFLPGRTRSCSVDLEFEGVKQIGARSKKPTAAQLIKIDIATAPRTTRVLAKKGNQKFYDAPLNLSFVLDKEYRPKIFFGDPQIASISSAFRIADDESLHSYANLIAAMEEGRRSRTASEPTSMNELISLLRDARYIKYSLLPERLVVSRDGDEDIEFRNVPMEFRGRYSTPTRALETLAEEFSRMSYLGPLRTPPARHYVIGDIPGDTVGSSGEYMPGIILRQNLDKEISTWFDRLQIPYRVKTSQIGNEITGQMISINLVDKRSKIEVGPSDVGFGIGQLLPILVEGVVFNERVICVEQPEIHLHPKLQAELADFLIDTSRFEENGPGNQWIVETHSEALMLRVLKRIRQGHLSPKDVSVLYVESKESGEGVVHELSIDEEGEFVDEWPDGFFEEDFNELFGEE
jgi:predicted ATPase